MAKTIGIDLGTTNSVVAYKDTTVRIISTGPDNEDLCRSCVAMDKSGSFVVGNSPYHNWRRYAPNIVVSAKRLMGAASTDTQVMKMKVERDLYPFGISKMSGGTDESLAIIIGGQEFAPEEISALVLRQLRDDASVKLGDEVTHAVITVPAYFNERQKHATRKAAELAGLKVQRLLAEPTAAALAYLTEAGADEAGVYLVYDFGGGTFDLSILTHRDGRFTESGTGGDRWLGGDDIDRIITDHVLQEVSRKHHVDIRALINQLPDRKKYAFQGELRTEVELAKKTLSHAPSATISLYDFLEDGQGRSIDIEVVLRREKYESMIRPLIHRTLYLIDQLLDKTGHSMADISKILLVGGSSCIPLVRQMLADRFGRDKILSSQRPMLAVAEGAAILSQALGTQAECPHCGRMTLADTDTCPHCGKPLVSGERSDRDIIVYATKHNYYIEITDSRGDKAYRQIIPANQSLPSEVKVKLHTTDTNQKIVSVDIYNDAEDDRKEKVSSGFVTIKEHLPARSELTFTFRLDQNEVMDVRMRVAATGKTQPVVLGRGGRDQHCYELMATAFDTVVGDSRISDDRKETFIRKLQRQIEHIQAVETKGTGHVDWGETERQIEAAATSARTRESSTDVNVLLAKILLMHFTRFIKADDRREMLRLISDYESAPDTAARNSSVNRLEQLNNSYSLFVSGFLLSMPKYDNDNPARVERALAAYSRFMSALGHNDLETARQVVDDNQAIIFEGGAAAIGHSRKVGV